jgi:iron complex outermembrane receptor protein
MEEGMNHQKKVVLAAVLAIGCCGMTQAQDTRESAIAHMRKVEAKEMDPGYHKTAPLAQKLVDDALAAHPEVILMAIHAGAPKYDIVASNFGRIGKLGDEDDLRCIHTGKPNLEVDATGKHYEVEMPMKDKAGTIIGALGVVFNYDPGADKKRYEKTATEIRDAMQARTPTASSLFGPA